MFGGIFGGGGTGGTFNDPFFNDMHQRMNQQMQQMDQLMNHMMAGDPFMMHGGPFLHPSHQQLGARQQMIRDSHGAYQQPPPPQQQQQHSHDNLMMSPFGFGGLLGGAGGLFGNMMRQMENAANDPNSHVISHSTVIGFDGLSGEQPRYYEATNSTLKQGQVKETRKTLRDSTTGEEKISVGHHIGDRAHVVEKRRFNGGDIREQQHLHNLRQEEVDNFDRHWRSRSGQGRLARLAGQRNRSHPKQIEDARRGDQASSSTEPVPIVEEPDDEVPPPPPPRYDERKRQRRGGPRIYEI